jgi:hypothetical protein
MDRRGVIYAAIYGAAAAGIAYLLSFGSLPAFIGIMIAFGITIRVWAWRYRVRHAPTQTRSPAIGPQAQIRRGPKVPSRGGSSGALGSTPVCEGSLSRYLGARGRAKLSSWPSRSWMWK